MKVKIPWCLRKCEVCKPQYAIRFYLHQTCSCLQCPNCEIIEASCETCAHLTHGLSSEMRFYGLKTPIDYCDRNEDLYDGCEFYIPKK